MKIAYADPPYIGQARRHYSHDPRCAEVDHAALVAQLETYDAWALSCSSPSLKQILSYCPDDVRVAAWVKPFCNFKPSVRTAYAWEPVIFRQGSKRTREQVTVRDWLACNMTTRRGLVGAKPQAFCFWVFELLNLQPDDEFVDMYPGSGAVTRAWEAWRRQLWLVM